jgi:hypothetical protein
MTLEMRDEIRWRDQMRIGTVPFCSPKRQVADMIRYVSARFVERDFDPGLLWCFGPTFVVLAFETHLFFLL